jgi:hypothetical protein
MSDEPERDETRGGDVEGRPDPAGGQSGAGPDRPRGLDSYFPPGGLDDGSPERRADERRMLRLLVLMVVLLIGIPTLLTIIAFVGEITAHPG